MGGRSILLCDNRRDGDATVLLTSFFGATTPLTVETQKLLEREAICDLVDLRRHDGQKLPEGDALRGSGGPCFSNLPSWVSKAQAPLHQ